MESSPLRILLLSLLCCGCSQEPDAEFVAYPDLPQSPAAEIVATPFEPLVAPKPLQVQSENRSMLDQIVATGMLRRIELKVPEKTFLPDKKSGALNVPFADLDLLAILNMDPVPGNATDYFPAWLKDLEGKQVRMRGFMVPPPRTMSEIFILARDDEKCCMGPETRIYHLLEVRMREGDAVEYFPQAPYNLAGTFRTEVLYEEGYWLGLYVLEDAVLLKR